MGTLNVVVLYDRWEEEDDDAAASDKTPISRTLDKKEVEDEVAEALGKLGHTATLHCLDGSIKSLHALARMECDLVFNLAESFAGNDTADACIAAYLELIDKRFTGAGSHGLLYAQDKAQAKKILEFHGVHTPVFARSFRGRLDFSHDLEFPVIVKPAREDGSIGIEFNAVVNSIRELMERIDWLHANFDSPVLIEEYVEGREMYVGVQSNLTQEEVIKLLTRSGQLDMKMGSADRVEYIYDRGLMGLEFTPNAKPPRALPVQAGLVFFQISRTTKLEEWQNVQKSMVLAIRLNPNRIVGNIDGQQVLTIRTAGDQKTMQFTLFLVPRDGSG